MAPGTRGGARINPGSPAAATRKQLEVRVPQAVGHSRHLHIRENCEHGAQALTQQPGRKTKQARSWRWSAGGLHIRDADHPVGLL